MNGMVERICVVGNEDLEVPTLGDEAAHWFQGSAWERENRVEYLSSTVLFLAVKHKKRLVPKDTNRFMFIVTTLISLVRHRQPGLQILNGDSFKWFEVGSCY